MPPKKKGQSTLDKNFGCSAMPQHNVENASNIPDLNDELNEDIDEDIVDDFEMFCHDENIQEGTSSGQRKRKTFTPTSTPTPNPTPNPTTRVFLEKWKIKHPWVYSINVGEGKTHMKCKFCEKYKVQGPWGNGIGCTTLQYDAMLSHSKFNIHRTSFQRNLYEIERLAKTIPEHLVNIDDANRERVITNMKLAYFIAKKDISIATYEDLCHLQMHLQIPNMPSRVEYSSYINRKAATEFIHCISDYLEEVQVKKMLDSPFFSFMLDESTDRGLEHLVVYSTFLDSKGLGPQISQFMKLIRVPDGKGKTIYDTIITLKEIRQLKNEKLIAVSTDGASSMVGNENGFVSLLKKDLSNLIGTHCISHREALAASDASKKIPEFLFVEKLANKVYSWVGNSAKRNNELISLLELMELESLQVLQIHGIRWLSRGEVVERLVTLMPTILSLWKKEQKNSWYHKARIFSVQFCLNMLADVLMELNKLNKKFQEDNVDVTSLGITIDHTLNTLRRNFCRPNSFAEGTIHISKFLKDSADGFLENVDKEGTTHRHDLLYIPIQDEQISQPVVTCIDGSLESCIQLTKNYVQALVDSFNSRFPDLHLFNAARIFSPCHYPSDLHLRETNAKHWLERLFFHLQPKICSGCDNVPVFDIAACERELYEFIDMLHLNGEIFSMRDAWRVFSQTEDWHLRYPNMLKVWQSVLVIPASTVACERGFSKKNVIKDIRRTKLSINMLDALMRVSLTGPDISEVEWQRVYEIWHSAKERRINDI